MSDRLGQQFGNYRLVSLFYGGNIPVPVVCSQRLSNEAR